MTIQQYIVVIIFYVDEDVRLNWFPVADLGINTNFVT
jgi:hypothetical protein